MKKVVVPLLLAAALFSGNSAIWACQQCRPLVRAGVYNQGFAENFLTLMLPLGVLGLIGVGIHYFADSLFAFAPLMPKTSQSKASHSERLTAVQDSKPTV